MTTLTIYTWRYLLFVSKCKHLLNLSAWQCHHRNLLYSIQLYLFDSLHWSSSSYGKPGTFLSLVSASFRLTFVNRRLSSHKSRNRIVEISSGKVHLSRIVAHYIFIKTQKIENKHEASNSGDDRGGPHHHYHHTSYINDDEPLDVPPP